MDSDTALLIAATVTNGVTCGAAWDQTVKQLPARHRIGAGAYTAYVRAADLRNGLIWYPTIGTAAVVTTAAAVASGLRGDPSNGAAVALSLMAVGLVAALAATTLAATTLLSLRRSDVPGGVAASLDRFARLNGARAAALAITLAATVWALALAVRSSG